MNHICNFDLKYPDCDRTVSALLQEYNRHPDLFGSAFNKPLGVEPPPESTPLDTVQITYSDPLPPWDEEDQEILVDFLRQHQPVQAHHWDELHGKVCYLSLSLSVRRLHG